MKQAACSERKRILSVEGHEQPEATLQDGVRERNTQTLLSDVLLGLNPPGRQKSSPHVNHTGHRTGLMRVEMDPMEQREDLTQDVFCFVLFFCLPFFLN